MRKPAESQYTLGLDLGVSSVGWALLDPANHRFVSAGVRVFHSGMDETKFAKGEQGASNNVERRMARLHRRQLRRRAGRQRDLFITLQEAGLLPAEPRGGKPDIRHKVITDLDARLLDTWRGRIQTENPLIVAPQHVLPYFLRVRALDHGLDPHELGRALYHLGQRRGYKSNRREGRKSEPEAATAGKKKSKTENDERKIVLAAIEGLAREMKESGARTLGEFLSRQDPAMARIRTRHTARQMFQQEFDAIWSAQQPHHAERLTTDLKTRIYALLFDQRPISAGKPGFCELERGCPRAPMAILAAQRFRLLQKVNDLAALLPQDKYQKLSADQRKKLADHLEASGDMTFEQARLLLGMPKGTRFNLATDGDKKLPGNRTNAVMVRAFGDRWGLLPEGERKHRVRLWAEHEDAANIVQIAVEDWGLDRLAAQHLADAHPEDGYCKLSLRAISNLLPAMEQGVSFKTAETAVYGNRFSGGEPKDHLPPVEEVLPQIPNPAVLRALTELRKVVNSIVRQHGKPAKVRVELARDLKRSAKDRQRLTDIADENRKRRAKVISRIQKEAGIPNPKGGYIEKGLLFEDLQECAYCGKTINFQALFSDPPLFDVDHIFPFSRFPDNSYSNKTLACNNCNALKTNRTPFQTFGADPELWASLVVRATRTRKTGKNQAFVLATEKRKRLLLGSPEAVQLWPDEPQTLEGFSARHLADTRYISKLAARYLEQLYGGRDQQVPWEDHNQRCVFASSGMVTATLRKAWGLNAVLRDGAVEDAAAKERGDHRHHAIDAMVIALSSQAAVQQLSAAAAVGDGRIVGRVSSRTLQPPWTGFVDSIRPLVEKLNISHRPDHKLGGPLHDETNYSPASTHRGKPCVHIRKPVHTLSAKDIYRDGVIVDQAVRIAVQNKLKDLDEDPKRLEHDPAVLITRTGKRVPIIKVRIREFKRTVPMRNASVALNENHHVWIAARLDVSDREVEWTGDVVSRYEAYHRAQREKPVIERAIRTEDGDVLQFKFSLMKGDLVEMEDWKNRERRLFLVSKFSTYSSGALVISLARHTDARIQAEKAKTGDFRGLSPETLRKAGCRKVIVDALGRVHECHD